MSLPLKPQKTSVLLRDHQSRSPSLPSMHLARRRNISQFLTTLSDSMPTNVNSSCKWPSVSENNFTTQSMCHISCSDDKHLSISPGKKAVSLSPLYLNPRVNSSPITLHVPNITMTQPQEDPHNTKYVRSSVKSPQNLMLSTNGTRS